MLAAGIEATVAVQTLNKTRHEDNKALARVTALLQRGQPISLSLKRTGLLTDFDFLMLDNAEKAGRVAQGLEHISSEQITSFEQRRTLATALLLPQAILIIGAVVAIFLRVFDYQQSMLSAIFEVSILVAGVLVLTRVFLNLWAADARYFLSLFWPSGIFRRKFAWFARHFEYNFYRDLSWQLESGIAADIAVDRCASMLRCRHYQAQVSKAAKSLQEGRPIVDSLMSEDLVLSSRMRQTLLIAQQAGTVDTSIKGELTLLRQQIELARQEQIRWLPKIYYVFILYFIFTQLI